MSGNDKTCLLCGEPWRYDEPMCFSCKSDESFWPPSYELDTGPYMVEEMVRQDDGHGRWFEDDDVLWLVALWRLMQQWKALTDGLTSTQPSTELHEASTQICQVRDKAWNVLDKLKKLETEAKQ